MNSNLSLPELEDRIETLREALGTLIGLDQAADHHLQRRGVGDADLCQSVSDARQENGMRSGTVSLATIRLLCGCNCVVQGLTTIYINTDHSSSEYGSRIIRSLQNGARTST